MVNQDFKGDESLCQLALEAQQSPPKSSKRQQTLNHLLTGIMKSGKLGHPQTGKYPRNAYEDLYNEALQKTMLRICKTIDQYNPVHPVMAWVNFVLNKSFIDVERDLNRKGITYIPQALKKDKITLSLDELNHHPPAAADHTNTQLLQQFLETDPDNLLKQEYIRNRPDITFQQLAIKKYIEDQTWEALSEHFDIPLQTLHSFFNRRLKQLMPYLRNSLQA